MVDRADGEEIETRGFGSPPLDVWRIGEDMEIDDGQADAMIHFLQSRAAERVMAAQEKVSAARGVYLRAKQFLLAEQNAVGVFLETYNGAYTTRSRRELLHRTFPERLRAADALERTDAEATDAS